MPIVAVATIKNEADVIEAMVRHNLAFVDRMVVLDNGSSDGSQEEARRHGARWIGGYWMRACAGMTTILVGTLVETLIARS